MAFLGCHPTGSCTDQAVMWGCRNTGARGAEQDVLSKHLPPEGRQQNPLGMKAAGEGEQVLLIPLVAGCC